MTPRPKSKLPRNAIACLVTAALAVAAPSFAPAATVSLTPSKDNTIYQDANLSNGAGPVIFAGRNGIGGGGRVMRGLLAFDLTGQMPAGATVTAAKLSLSVNTPNPTVNTVKLHRLLADWGEGTSVAASGGGGGAPSTTGDATWSFRFFNTASPWSVEGADFAASPSASRPIPGSFQTAVFSSPEMAADVQAWLDNPASNFGWALVAADETTIGDAVRFASREDVFFAPSLEITYTEPTAGCLVNLSIRSGAGAGSQTLIVGFVADGGNAGSQISLLVRAAGPVLTAFGVPGALPDPSLAIHNSGQTVVAANDNWGGVTAALAAQVGAFPFPDPNSLDAALALALNPAPYTAVVTGVGGTTGVALAEIYDANTDFDPAKPQLVNASARTQVNTGADILIAGFVIGGDTSQTVLIRAVGPTLANFGVTGVLADPELKIYNSSAVQIGSNDDWSSSLAATFTQVGAFALPADSKDAALVVTLPPGAYTVHVSGVGGTTGVALAEVYAVP